MCINHTQKHYQQQRQDLSHFVVPLQHFLNKHLIAIRATLCGVYAYMQAAHKINTQSPLHLLKGNAALTVKVTAQSYDLTHHTMLIPANSVKV